MLVLGGCIAAARDRVKGFAPIKKTLGNLMRKVKELDEMGFFQVPVREGEAPDYYDIIKKPMDMETMTRKLAANRYPYLTNFVVRTISVIYYVECIISGPDIAKLLVFLLFSFFFFFFSLFF
jgi:hypothetical protein